MVIESEKNNRRWGLGLLVLFLDDNSGDCNYMNNKKKPTKCYSGTHGSLIHKAQSTISICAFILLFTITIFTLLISDPPANPSLSSKFSISNFPRRLLRQRMHYKSKGNINIKDWANWTKWKKKKSIENHALQGMGTLFRRGNQAMKEILVAHLSEDTNTEDLRLFLRFIHRSGFPAKSDIVLLFPCSNISSSVFYNVIEEENDLFMNLLLNETKNYSGLHTEQSGTHFNFNHYNGSEKKKREGSLWGRGIGSKESNSSQFNWGAIVGFTASELDPEDLLSGFFQRVPMQLRRWTCYSMLFGRIRRNFKHLMLTQVNNVLIVGDAMSRVRTQNTDGNAIYFWTEKESTQQLDNNLITPAVIVGGIRAIRRLSDTFLTEIVRVAVEDKKRTHPLSEAFLLTRLVRSSSLLQTNMKITVLSFSDKDSVIYRNSSSSSSSSSSPPSSYDTNILIHEL